VTAANVTAASVGATGRHGLGFRLEIVGEGLERRRLGTAAMSEGDREQPVGQPRVSGKQGAMEVRPDRTVQPTAFPTALPVVAEAPQHPPQRSRPRVEERAAGVVLEAGEGVTLTGLELALE
jgi:hypothetical protein